MGSEFDSRTPALSVILPSPERIALVMRTVAALARQNVADRIELVIVVRDASEAPPTEVTAPLGWVHVVPMARWTTMTAARAAGIRHSCAPIVALAEDHCFPAPDWADALLRAHCAPWAAVGPAFLNANPATILSWANLGIEYGPWLLPVPPGACAHVPGHNSSYKREVLVAYGPRLEAMLEAESVLHWDLLQRGYQVAMEPSAQVRHENFSRFAPSLALRFSVGRLFAASRALAWPWWKRVVFAVGSTLLPVLRTWRTLRHLQRVGPSLPRHGLTATVFVLLVFDAVGEGCGYAFGAGDQSRRLSELEHNRPRFLTARDREAARP